MRYVVKIQTIEHNRTKERDGAIRSRSWVSTFNALSLDDAENIKTAMEQTCHEDIERRCTVCVLVYTRGGTMVIPVEEIGVVIDALEETRKPSKVARFAV